MKYKLLNRPNHINFKNLSIVLISLVFVYILISSEYGGHDFYADSSDFVDEVFLKNRNEHDSIVEKFYENREKWDTSNIGTLLFKRSVTVSSFRDHRQNKTFVVLVWKHFEWLKNRHIRGFNNSRSNPLETCSVKNCIFTGDENLLDEADAVLVHLQHGNIPEVKNRNVNQRWIFLTDEAPKNTFSLAKTKPKLSELANVFNWSMTYRSDSDIPVPSGRTVALPVRVPSEVSEFDLVPNWWDKKSDVIATILISNCGASYRNQYLKELKKELKIDDYGGCSKQFKNVCPGHFRADCTVVSKYLFYLAFENSNCEQYMTEKAYYHAYKKGAIPVILGPPLEDCLSILPPNSFLHVDNYKSPKELADHMIRISKSDNNILAYHKWRKDFHVLNEHGYFGTNSVHFCRLCEALNYNDEEKKTYDYESIRYFLDPEINCQEHEFL